VPVRTVGGEQPLIDAEPLALRVVADVAGVTDHVVAVIGVRAVAVGGDLAADAAVVPKCCAIRMVG